MMNHGVGCGALIDFVAGTVPVIEKSGVFYWVFIKSKNLIYNMSLYIKRKE